MKNKLKINALYHNRIHELPAIKESEWNFIPSCSHIELVKIVHENLQEQSPKEDTLQTPLAEVENCIKSHFSVSYADDECWTPNHFLLISNNALLIS